jgi:hypothetical protein
LALRVNRVKGERGFTRTGQPREDHQLISWYLQGNILEIVGSSPLNSDGVCHVVRLLEGNVEWLVLTIEKLRS